MLHLRILSALVLIPLVLFVVALGEPWLVLLVALAVGLALDELYRLFAAAGHRPVRWAGLLSAAFLVLAAFTAPAGESGCGCTLRLPGAGLVQLPATITPSVGTGAALAASVLVTLIAQLLRRDRGGALTDWALTLAGAVYVGWTFSHFVLLRELNTPQFSPPFWQALGAPDLGSGAWWLLTTFLLVWLGDTAAYFVGSRWGRHKLSPAISPKKSWEGAAAGLLASVGTAVGLVPLLGLPLSYPVAAVLGALAGVVGPVGDLAESLLKRQAGVKDSGTLIPGHGGILDRADSLLFVVPVVYYLLEFIL
jgi:phosphatidate cytidylyltransferase